MSALARAVTPNGAVTDPIRVMVVDDSVVIRGLVGRWIDGQPELAVVASHRNGVWDKPGAAAHTGQCCDVLPLPAIGRKVARILLGARA
jgi:hypothetical protein